MNEPVMRRATIFKSVWGWMGISETAQGIDAIALPKGSKRAVEFDLRGRGGGLLELGESARLETTRQQLLEYLAGSRTTFDVPIDCTRGTAFQWRVWRVLQRVPYGKVRSYRWIAVRVGGWHYARAVGNAVAANPLPIVIPCHRIVGEDGSPGGFSCGLRMKRKLLTLEGTWAMLNVE